MAPGVASDGEPGQEQGVTESGGAGSGCGAQGSGREERVAAAQSPFLRKNEHVCAMALLKRKFAGLSQIRHRAFTKKI